MGRAGELSVGVDRLAETEGFEFGTSNHRDGSRLQTRTLSVSSPKVWNTVWLKC
jgi:hypothetical protein